MVYNSKPKLNIKLKVTASIYVVIKTVFFFVLCVQECVWGVAYEIPPEDVARVTEHLDFREKGGYEAVMVEFHPQDPNVEPFDLKIYIGTEDNPFFLDPAELTEMAEQIYTSEGPSGKNTEYLFELVEAMKQLVPGVEDKHLFELDREVRRLAQLSAGS